MAGHHEVIDLAKAEDTVVFVDVRYVRVVERELDLAQEVCLVLALSCNYFRLLFLLRLSLLVDDRGEAVVLAVLVLHAVSGHDDVFVLRHQLPRAVQLLLVSPAVLVGVANLDV